MPFIPAIAFAAYSDTGKTTLIEKVVRCLKHRNVRLAVVKHDVHGFNIDHEGKDTWRFAQAGSDVTVIGSPAKTAFIEQRERSIHEIIERIDGVDLILVEGYKNEDLPMIGVCRAETGKGFTADLSRFLAVVTDLGDIPAGLPCFGLDDIEPLADFIMEYAGLRCAGVKNEADFTHFNEQGRAKMVNVGEKAPSHRTAVAGARVLVSRETFALIKTGGMKKGDVLTVAQVAGIMGAKRTPDIIPMCHPVMITGVNLELTLDEARCAVNIRATASCDGQTGVEMEALSAASIAALTVYDMCKAVQKDIVISDVRLLEKTGGVHGDFKRKEA